MKYYIDIPHNGTYYRYPLLENSRFQLIDLKGTIYLIIYKHHNHKYEMGGFLETKRHYIYQKLFTSKKELYGAIQKLLQENLHVDKQ